MQLKEFKKALQEKSSLISDVFLEQKKQIITSNYGDYFINSDLKLNYDPRSEDQIQEIKKIYAYFDILKEQRKDIPYNILELSHYEYNREESNYELIDFIQHCSVETLEQKILKNWYYLFDRSHHISQLYNKIILNPSYEQYKRHYVTHLILDHIYTAKYAIGVIKEDLSLYEQAIIEKIKPFKNLEKLQMELPFRHWLFNPKTAYNRLNKLFEKEPHIKIGFEKISKKYNFEDI